MPELGQVSWMRSFEAAIASQMRFWGGGQNILLPYTETVGENELFWQLLDRADPDQILVYTGSVMEAEQLDPEWLAADRQSREEALSDIPGEHASYWEDWRRLPLIELPDPGELRDEVLRRVAPLRFPGGEEWVETNAAIGPLRPFTDVTKFTELPPKVSDISPSNLGDLERLLLTVEVGRLSPDMREELLARGIEVDTEELAGSGPARMKIFRRSPSESTYPLALCELGLAWYRSGPWRPLPVPIVVGDDPWDFALFYALRRWGSLAYWIPESSLADETYCRNVLGAVEVHQATAYGAVIVSASSPPLTNQAHQSLLEWQERLSGGRPPRVELSNGTWEDVLAGRPVNRLYERDNFDRPQALYLHEGSTPALPTPTPERVATNEVHTLRWFTDVVVDGWGALRDLELPSVVLVGHGFDREQVRVGRDAPCYLSPRAITFGGMSPKAAALRPQLVPLALLEQLRHVAVSGGWHVTQSDKGVYAWESARLFGGASELAAVLRDAPVRRVIDGFVLGDGDGQVGRLLADRRRYLTYEDFEALAGSDEAERALAHLEVARAVTRGLVLKCQRCRAGAFYTPAESDPSFRCRSCRLEQRPTRASWLNEIEPVWHYGLDEVLRRFVDQRGHLPLFAAVDLLTDADDPASVEFAFELEFRNDADAALEFDIVARKASELWVGEATTRDRLANGGASERERLDLIHRLASDLNARHAVLASSQTFRQQTHREATRRLKSPWYQLHITENIALGAVILEAVTRDANDDDAVSA